MDKKTLQRTKFFTVLAITMLVVLLLVLITLLIQRAQLIETKNELQSKIDYYQDNATGLTEELDKRNTVEYIEQKARELGMIDDDETAYQAK